MTEGSAEKLSSKAANFVGTILIALKKIARGSPNGHPLSREEARATARNALAKIGVDW